MEVGRAPVYGEIVDSDMVHDEIRALGTEVKQKIAECLPRHGTSSDQVQWGIRQFGPSKESRKVLNKENEAAILACETGVYVVWRCTEVPKLSGANNDFCCRLGKKHRCFCGHSLASHGPPPTSSTPAAKMARWKSKCEEAQCGCKGYRYIPNTPLEIGEGWLTRRRDWDPTKWSAKCRCGHGHRDHDPSDASRCRCCGCGAFSSHFLCVVCDLPWEAHETIWETEQDRLRQGFPVREDYAPLAKIDWDVREAVLADPTLGGRMEPPVMEITSDAGPALGVEWRKPQNGTATSSRQRQITDSSRPPKGDDPVLDAAYCRYCATIFKSPASKFCSSCGRPRHGGGA